MDEGFQGALGKVCNDEVSRLIWTDGAHYSICSGCRVEMGFMVFRYEMGGLEVDSMVAGGWLDT
jgi:hypothetical protein